MSKEIDPMIAWEAENLAFLKKIGQIDTTNDKPQPAKKDEE